MREYPTVYLDTNFKVKEQLVVIKDVDVNEHERISNSILRYKF